MPHTLARALDDVAIRLHDEFGTLSGAYVARCVSDTGRCLENLGYDPTPSLVERHARERLDAVRNSAPPSGLVTPDRPDGGAHPATPTSTMRPGLP